MTRTMIGLALWDHGFAVAGTSLWLDSSRAVEFVFASDAAADLRAARVLATSATVEFLKARRPWPAYLPAPLQRTFAVGDADVSLHAAGTMPGGAQIVLRHRDHRVLYFRRILPEPVGLGEPLETPPADVVLVDAPGGLDPRACSGRAERLDALRAWVEGTLAANDLPVLLVERLVAGPAVVARLAPLGCELRLHPQIYSNVRRCARLGLDVRRAWEFRGHPRVGQVILLPHAYGTPEVLGRIPRARVAVVTDGTAEVPPGLPEPAVFPVAFSAGVPEIAAHVQRTGAAIVLLSPATPAALVDVLHGLGVRSVERVGPPEQLSLVAGDTPPPGTGS